ncbi:3-phosphoshikimate 1-carboxyvinyltransferase, partial [Streptomyces pharetrae]
MTATDVSAPATQARIPGSKSLTNRALLLAAAAGGVSTVWAPLLSDDTRAFRAALTSFGVAVRSSPTSEFWEVTGLGGGPVGQARLW